MTEQKDWEEKRLAYKGPTNSFHKIKPDFAEYFNWLRDFAGHPAKGTKGYELPALEDKWGELAFAVLALKDAHWKHPRGSHGSEQIQAKL